jgi:cytochrome c peroxidase
MSCGTCHDPAKGWTDGLPTSRGFAGKALLRATPTIINSAYATVFMWDGSASSLEEQSLGPIDSLDEMGANSDEVAANSERVLRLLNGEAGYRQAFARAYPGEAIDRLTLAKAIASFERTVVGTHSPFDQWLAGDRAAMSPQQIRGFRIFNDPEKGNCSTCHQPPHFTDNGFHNIGLASYGNASPDLGRYEFKPVAVNKGAFKTPGLRNVATTAPYFHDGSVATLTEVVEHYVSGGRVRTNLSPDMKKIVLSAQEKEDLLAFLGALTDEQVAMTPSQREARAGIR